MSINNTLRVLIASSSIIIRSGIAAALKRMHELNIQSVEISTPEMLEHYVTLHTPDMILIDPNFGGWFDLTGFRETYNNLTNVKFVAIIANVIDNSHLKDYHEKQTQENDTEPLSQREKEIITYVVKGLTNKEIADKLCLSVHTVITHRRNIARKLQIHSPAGLTIYAIVNKLVELKDVEL